LQNELREVLGEDLLRMDDVAGVSPHLLVEAGDLLERHKSARAVGTREIADALGNKQLHLQVLEELASARGVVVRSA
jgi:hypothetical protein